MREGGPPTARWRLVSGAVAHEVALAARALFRAPMFVTAVVAILGVGVGITGAVFSVVDAMYLKPPTGIQNPSGLRRVWKTLRMPDGPRFVPGFSYAEVNAMHDAVTGGIAIAPYRAPLERTSGPPERPTKAVIGFADGDFFKVLGVRPEIGELYSGRSDGPAPINKVAVLSYDYWVRAFGRDPHVIGTTIEAVGGRFAITGVVQQDFKGVDMDAADLWLPLGNQTPANSPDPWWKGPFGANLRVVIRIPNQVSQIPLEQHLEAAIRHTAGSSARTDSTTKVRLGSIVAAAGPGRPSRDEMIATRLLGASLIALVIAIGNVLSLLLQRAEHRRHEFAMRIALGVSKFRLAGLLSCEALVLATLASAVALLVGYAAGGLLRRTLLPGTHWGHPPFDLRCSLITVGVTITATAIASAVPLRDFFRTDLRGVLSDGKGASHAGRRPLAAALLLVQTAFAVVLLVTGFVFVDSFSQLRHLDLGYEASHVLTATLPAPRPQSSADTSDAPLYEVLREVTASRGVDGAALTSTPPMAEAFFIPFYTENDSLGSRAGWLPSMVEASAGYFRATGIALLRGRGFDRAVSAVHTPEVVVNSEMARVLWPGLDPVGKCIRFMTPTAACYRVVGVAANSRRWSVVERSEPQYYLPMDALPSGAISVARPSYLIVHSRGAKMGEVESTVRSVLARAYPGSQPSLMRLDDFLEPQYKPWRLSTFLFVTVAVAALVLTLLGLITLLLYDVGRRRREFGIRIALGAPAASLILAVVRDSLARLSLGLFVGIVAANAAGHVISALLFNGRVSIGSVVPLVAVLLLGAGGIASLLPAIRAARIDPVITLRAD